MNLPDQDIEEFAALWHGEFDETLSLDEARLHASRLLELCAALLEKAPELHRPEGAASNP